MRVLSIQRRSAWRAGPYGRMIRASSFGGLPNRTSASGMVDRGSLPAKRSVILDAACRRALRQLDDQRIGTPFSRSQMCSNASRGPPARTDHDVAFLRLVAPDFHGTTCPRSALGTSRSLDHARRGIRIGWTISGMRVGQTALRRRRGRKAQRVAGLPMRPAGGR